MPFSPPGYAVWLNTLWFTGLVFSLASATSGIIVKQWLKEYKMGLYGSSRDIARRRQFRLNNLEKWGVPNIIAFIPVLLLIALILFLAGLAIFLNSIHMTVAIVASTFSCLLLAFLLLTTLLPTFFETCCFYSPQASTVFFVSSRMVGVLNWISSALERLPLDDLSTRTTEVLAVIIFLPPIILRSILKDMAAFASLCVIPVWKGGDHDISLTDYVQLDVDTMITAYTSTLDVGFIDSAIVSLDDAQNQELSNRYTRKLSDILHRRMPQNGWSRAVQRRISRLHTHMLYASLSFNSLDRSGESKFPNISVLEGPLVDLPSGLQWSPDTLALLAILSITRSSEEGSDKWWNYVFNQIEKRSIVPRRDLLAFQTREPLSFS